MNKKNFEENKRPGFLAIGKIVKTHGLRGELILTPYSVMPEDIESLDHVFVDFGEHKSFPVERCRPHKERYILKLEGIDTIEEAENYRGKELFFETELLPDETAEWLFLEQSSDISVYDCEGAYLGRLHSVIHTAGHPVFAVKTDENREFMVPAVEEFIIEIDIDGGRLVIDPPEGLLDIYEI